MPQAFSIMKFIVKKERRQLGLRQCCGGNGAADLGPWTHSPGNWGPPPAELGGQGAGGRCVGSEGQWHRQDTGIAGLLRATKQLSGGQPQLAPCPGKQKGQGEL